uniref:Uncharacterized protein n=1 Tax=Prymnesium polylepis TaxID=72548 RepID=A0A7S4NEX5_9EUKA
MLTCVCAAYTIFFGQERRAEEGRAKSERIFLANALGMVQGWSWSDLVDWALKDYIRLLEDNRIVKSGELLETVALLVGVVVISAVMLIAHVWVTQPSSAIARANWRRGVTALRLLKRTASRKRASQSPQVLEEQLRIRMSFLQSMADMISGSFSARRGAMSTDSRCSAPDPDGAAAPDTDRPSCRRSATCGGHEGSMRRSSTCGGHEFTSRLLAEVHTAASPPAP